MVKKIITGCVVFFLALLTAISVSGCRSGMMAIQADRSEIQSADPAIRVRAIIHATRAKDMGAVPLIVDRLEDDDEAVRFVAIKSLKELTENDLGYCEGDPPYVRAQAVDRWRKWLKENTKAVTNGTEKKVGS
jgi:HEAT repeat protein